MWNLWNPSNQPSTSKHGLFDFSKQDTVGCQNVDNSNSSSFGSQYNICGHNNTISVSATQVKTDGLEVQVSEPVFSFYGRDDVLGQMHKALQEPHGGNRRRLVVLCGPGGIGKTECARAYIHRFRATYTNIVWLCCENEQDIKSSLENVYSQMNLAASSSPHDMYGHLNSNRTLFVFDNAQDMNSISKYLPRKESKCLFLVTSQVKNWSPHVSVELDKLDVYAAMNVLGAVLKEHDITVDTPRLGQLAQRLDRIPLVLQISAGFICQQVLDLRSMNEEYNIDEIFSELETEYVIITTNFPDFFDCNDYLKSVYAALMRTIDKVWSRKDQLSQLATDALGVVAYLHPEQLRLQDFKTVLNIEDDKLFMRAWAMLLNYSLVQKCFSQNFTVHRSIQQCLQLHYINNNATKYYETTLKLLLDDNIKDDYHFPVIYEHGVRYYEIIRQFYSQHSSGKTFKALTYYSSIELMALLVKDLHLIQNFEFLCLAAMAWSRNPNIMQMLLDNGADFNSVDDVGNVLHHLCISSQYQFGSLFYTCCVFIKYGVNPKTLNVNGQTAIDIARQMGHTALAEILESMNPNMNNVTQLAIKHNLFGCLLYLFKHDVITINQQDEMGNTVIHALCSSDTKWNLYSLTSRFSRIESADLRIRNATGETAADVAKRNGHLGLAELLQPDVEGPRDLYVAAKYGDLQAIRVLPNLTDEYVMYRDEFGRTPLHMLCVLNKDTFTDQQIIDTITESNLYKYFQLEDNDECCPCELAIMNGRDHLAIWIIDKIKVINERNMRFLMTYVGNQLMQYPENVKAETVHKEESE